ncbi:MAG: DegT/DnrJ/EryC1/StrS aminotransferase family protein [Methylovulum sp.]|nr:MAG: DegT/DnrJ/EryC1/StrS aminotransferase family protein [Methylovulum sp.]
MKNNISRADLDSVIDYLKRNDPKLTAGRKVLKFEQTWSEWLGVKYSVYVNSGASANLITITALKEVMGGGEIIVSPLNWVSDIASIIQCGFKPVFADINLQTLGMDSDEIIKKITSKTKAVLLTHILGYNALNQNLLDELKFRDIPLIEDTCESHGATFKGSKLGNFGLMSNFSFYYAHHMTTIEGGMVSTNNINFYQILRMLRAHGMVRESTSQKLKQFYFQKYPDLNPDFIFAFPAYNFRPTEIGAIIGLSQIKNLDKDIVIRQKNLKTFLTNLDSDLYHTDFITEGSSNYAFTLILKKPNQLLCEKVMKTLRRRGVEFRRGTSGGGNQLRQPYLRKILGDKEYKKYPNVDHVHFYGMYIGNYPTLEEEKIYKLCKILNNLK